MDTTTAVVHVAICVGLLGLWAVVVGCLLSIPMWFERREDARWMREYMDHERSERAEWERRELERARALHRGEGL